MPLLEDNEPPSTTQSFLGRISTAAESAAVIAAERTVECLETKVRKTADELKEQANNYLLKLLEKKEAVDQDRQRLHALIEEYHAQKSTFSQWAEWHATLAWYEEVGCVVAFVGVSALIGFAFELAALFTLLSIAIVYFARSLFMEHYGISLTQNDALIAGISAMINGLILSINQLTALAQDVNAIQVELDEQCTQMEREIGAFRTQVVEMNSQMDELKNQAHALEQVKEALIQENERFHLERDKANIEITKAGATIAAQSTELSDIQNRLDETHQKLLDQNKELTQVQTEMKTNLKGLSEIRGGYERELTFFTSQHAKMNEKGTGSEAFNENEITDDYIKQQLLESEALLLEAQRMFGH